MSGYRNHGRHSAPTDPMMTNSYLIRARSIRDAALSDADRRESIALAGTGDRRWSRFMAVIARLPGRVTGLRLRRPGPIDCTAISPEPATG